MPKSPSRGKILYLYFCMAILAHAWCAQYYKNLYFCGRSQTRVFAIWPKCSNRLVEVLHIFTCSRGNTVQLYREGSAELLSFAAIQMLSCCSADC